MGKPQIHVGNFKQIAGVLSLEVLGVPRHYPNYGRLVNPISTRGCKLCAPNDTGTPRFLDLSTALVIGHVTSLISSKYSSKLEIDKDFRLHVPSVN